MMTEEEEEKRMVRRFYALAALIGMGNWWPDGLSATGPTKDNMRAKAKHAFRMADAMISEEESTAS